MPVLFSNHQRQVFLQRGPLNYSFNYRVWVKVNTPYNEVRNVIADMSMPSPPSIDSILVILDYLACFNIIILQLI